MQDTANTAYFVDPAATGDSLILAGTASASGNLTVGNGSALRSSFGPLSLQYKSGLNSWATGLTIQDTSGNVGIGTTGPGAKLEVSGGNIRIVAGQFIETYLAGARSLFGSDATGHGQTIIKSIDSDVGDGIQFQNSAGSPIVEILNTGNLGIGTTGPTYQLQLSTDSAGKPNGGSWANSSDARLKTDIAPISHALNRLAKLTPVSFTWRNPSLHGGLTKSGGFLAQNVMAEFPSWVSQIDAEGADKQLVGPDGKAYSLTLPFEYDALVVAALKELKAENEMLKARVAVLEERLK